MRAFGCPVTILNTLDHLGKFDGKENEGFLVGYSINSKAFRVYSSRTKKVEENLHVNYLENKPNVARSGPEWLFNIDSLTNSTNYQLVGARNRTNGNAGSKINSDAGKARKEKVHDQEYILLPLLNTCSNVLSSYEEAKSSPKDDAGKKSTAQPTYVEGGKTDDLGINDVGSSFSHPGALDDYSKMTNLEDTGIFDDAYDDRVEGAEADYNNLDSFKLLNVWTLVELPHGKRAIGTKWVFRNKRDQRRIVVRNKVMLVAQGHRQEEGIDYDEVFAPVARIEEISLFLAYASFMDFTVYQMDVKSAFLYGTIEEEVYVSQPPGFVDPEFPDIVYRVEKALYGLHQAPRASYETLSTYLLENGFRRGQFIRLCSSKRSKMTFYLFNVKTASTPMETHKPLSKDANGTDVDVHLYRLISWQCKKQTIMANSTTEAEYIATSNCCGQVVLLQNQLLDYGYNFMQTKIHVDNEREICVVKRLIEIRHHFIRDSYEKRLIEMVKIHTDYDVADLFTKAFDVTRWAWRAINGQDQKLGEQSMNEWLGLEDGRNVYEPRIFFWLL
nr:putative ribonuclease H-like domain-containing protein [Tanacetum cinerariifolium]